MNKNIVVFNNETGIVETMAPLFAKEGFHMTVAATRKELLTLLEDGATHLMLIDAKLDERNLKNGVDFIAILRKKTTVPIIVVSAQNGENAKVLALNAGADDYVTAGCNPLELLARVKSQLRRYFQLFNPSTKSDVTLKVDELEIDDASRAVLVSGREVKLTPIEYKILRLLVQQRGRVLSIEQIYEAIWKMQPIGADNTIAVHIRHIREKIETNPKEPHYLKVVWGTGYKVG